MNEEQMKHIANLISQDIEKDKEIERLSKDCDMWNRKYNEQVDIINELEKYIGQEYYCFDNESVEFEVAKNILDKLKELKNK